MDNKTKETIFQKNKVTVQKPTKDPIKLKTKVVTDSAFSKKGNQK